MSFPSIADAGLSLRRRYLVGVSGGRDSVALLHWLMEEGCRKLVVCHLNHGLRGRQSGADAVFVRRLAKSHGLAFETEKVAIDQLAEERGVSLEEAGREARHEFFRRIGRDYRCTRVVLGHHADDQVETVLMNLCRGTGNLGGMRRVSEVPTPAGRLQLLRPLLGVWRNEVDAYLDARRLAYREDGSNASEQFLRNRIRARLVPCLKETFRRDVTRAIGRAAKLAAGESDFLDELVSGCDVSARCRGQLSVPKMRKLDIALQRRVILAWLRGQGIGSVGFDVVERVRLMLDDERLAKVNLPGDRHARRQRKVLFVE
ncbi:MAG: tRNA lysidine(34) synthetase TilS [Verrucomicrobiales bacterium]|nr:tRNA lysidine(34) synthetase TilS [Verrucomicrobiales bacterium]